MAGRRDPNDPRASLFKDFLRFVQHFHPKYVVIENVIGLLTMKDSDNNLVKDEILGSLMKMGYSTQYAKLFAPDYGIPQKRRRVFIIGQKADTSLIVFPPVKTHTPESYVSVSKILDPRENIHTKYFHSQKMIDGFNRRKLKNKENGKGFGAQYLDLFKPSYTISARYWKDGADALVKYDENTIRMLTEQETARIQSFPDTYKFTGSSREIYTQIGNAVPVELARHVGLCIVNSLSENSKKMTMPST